MGILHYASVHRSLMARCCLRPFVKIIPVARILRKFPSVLISKIIEMFLLRFPNYFQFSNSNRWSLFISYFLYTDIWQQWSLPAVGNTFFPEFLSHHAIIIFSLSLCFFSVYSTYFQPVVIAWEVCYWSSSLFHTHSCFEIIYLCKLNFITSITSMLLIPLNHILYPNS